MANTRANVPVLEQPRRLGRRVALIAGLALAGVGLVLFLQPRREPVAGHAFAVPVPDGRVVVEVLNGTRRSGIARIATRTLRRRGFDVVYVGNADSTVTTRVVVRRGDIARGQAVAEAFGAQVPVVTEVDTLRRVDVSVILGRDYNPPAELHP